MMTKVWLHYSNLQNGPGGVVRNLEDGLKEIGVELVKQPNKADYHGCLQNPGPLYDKLPDHTLMGPNLFVLPFEAEHICNKFYNFVVPSQWVKDKYLEYDVMKGCNIEVWPVGIDTETWKPSDQEPEFDCFVYHKFTSTQMLDKVLKRLKDKNMSVAKVLKYGFYREEELKDLCIKCKFAVLLTGTESQGLAYMQTLSTDTPCFVLDKTTWHYEGRPPTSARATSVPYFDERCGRKVEQRHDDDPWTPEVDEQFDMFIQDYYNACHHPRNYILENHTLAQGAERYLELLKRTQEKKP